MIRILLVDDQNLVQQGIKSLLDQDPEIKVIGTVKDGRTALTQINQLRPDIVLLDIEMPGMDGITTTKYITHLAPQTKVIILSSHEDKKYLTRALMAGAKSYILKNSLMSDLKQSIVAVSNGYTQIESRLLAKIFDPSNLKQPKAPKANPPRQQLPKLGSNSEQKARDHSSARVNNASVPDTQSLVFSDQVTSVNSSDGATTNPVDAVKISPSQTDDIQSPNSVPAASQIDLASARPEHFSDLAPEAEQVESDSSAQLLPNGTTPNVPTSQLEGQQFSHAIMLAPAQDKIPHLANRSPIAKYREAIINFYQAKKIQYQPLINLCQSRLAEYRAKLQPRLQLWYEKGWLANAALVF
ncbi:MAG: response regulator transcription factor, partial [Cyanobacteria bacterium J06623_1]